MNQNLDKNRFHPVTIPMWIIAGLIILPVSIFFLIQHYLIVDPLPEGSTVPSAILSTMNGELVSTDSLLTQEAIFVFFSPTCVHCKHLLASLQTMFGQPGKHLSLYAISSGSMTETKTFMADKDLSFPVLFDSSGKVRELYRVKVVPALFFIDAHKVLKNFMTGEIGEERLTGLMEKYLK